MSNNEKLIENFGEFELWEEFDIEEINDADYPVVDTEKKSDETSTPYTASEQVA